MTEDAPVERTVRQVCREHDGRAFADEAALDAVPYLTPVRLVAAGYEPGVLSRAGAPHTVAELRGACQALTRRGHPVFLEAPLVDVLSTPEAFVTALWEVVRLDLRTWGRLQITVPVPDDLASLDPWIQAAFAPGVIVADDRYTRSLTNLYAAWRAHLGTLPADEARAHEIRVRQLDDGFRVAVFEALRRSWLESDPAWPLGQLSKEDGLEMAESLLGERERWLKFFRQYTYDNTRRMVVIPTWQCELRCSYCFIPKQDGRVMSAETMRRSVDMLMSTTQPELILQFFGGEALLEWERVQEGIAYGTERAEALGKRISFVVSSNGWSLDEAKLSWMAQYPVRMELSLDGDRTTQDRYRTSRWPDQKSYDHSIATHRDAILASGIPHWVIMVVHPTDVDNMPANFFHIADLGFKRIQINNMLGRMWKPEELQSFARGLHAIGQELKVRWARGEQLEFINMNNRPMAMRLNGEVTIDHDGVIFGGNGFLHETEHKAQFAVAHLDDLTNVDRYWIDATDNNFLLDWSYKPKVTQNNIEVGKVMTSFIKWMNREGFGATGPSSLVKHETRPRP